MKNSFFNKPISRSLCAVVTSVAMLSAACAPVVVVPPEKVVTELAGQRWKALVDGDFAKAYELTAPSYRAVVDLKTFQKQFAGGGVHWTDAKTSKVVCEIDKCNVTVDVTGVALAGTSRLTRTVPVHEVWILENNRWWQFDKKL